MLRSLAIQFANLSDSERGLGWHVRVCVTQGSFGVSKGGEIPPPPHPPCVSRWAAVPAGRVPYGWTDPHRWGHGALLGAVPVPAHRPLSWRDLRLAAPILRFGHRHAPDAGGRLRGEPHQPILLNGTHRTPGGPCDRLDAAVRSGAAVHCFALREHRQPFWPRVNALRVG